MRRRAHNYRAVVVTEPFPAARTGAPWRRRTTQPPGRVVKDVQLARVLRLPHNLKARAEAGQC